jgi:cyanate lyase
MPCKDSLPTDPLIYRSCELINVYGTSIKEVIHEEFSDGIMGAIDFPMNISRESDPKGNRVSIARSGKLLPYKMY